MATNDDLVPLYVVPQHPDTTEPVRVHVQGPLLTGPVGSRLAVFDYNRDHDLVFPGAPVRDDGGFDQDDGVNGLHFQQLNAYAIAARAIGFVERELGHRLSWGFEGGRLFILPHAGQKANAFYSARTKSLQFYSYLLGEKPYHTCLVHDIVAHEVGHALLDAARSRYKAALHPETAAIHEAFGDLTAVLAALSHDVVLSRMLDDEEANLRTDNQVAKIADDFRGSDPTSRSALRNLADSAGRDFDGVTEPHDLSLKLTTALYQALRRLFDINRENGDDGKTALRRAHRGLQRMVVRGLDFLPPADATFEDFARGMLQADAVANPDDQLNYRAAVAESLAARGIGNSARDLLDTDLESDDWAEAGGQWPPRTPTDAYLFLDRRRERLALGVRPEYRDFWIRQFHISRRPTQAGTGDEIENVVIVYEYPDEVLLEDDRFGSVQGRWVTVWGGGTLVFDRCARLRFHAEKPVTEERKTSIRDFLGSQLSQGQVALHEQSVPLRHGDMVRRPFIATVDGDVLAFRTNLAAGCAWPNREASA